MKLAHSQAKEFPKLERHLKTNFPNVLKKASILKGFKAHGIDYKDAVIYSTYGYDPLIEVKPILSGGNGAGGFLKIEEWAGGGVAYGLQIPTSLVKAFNRDEDLMTFSVVGDLRWLDAALVMLLVVWRKIAEVGGATTTDEISKVLSDFKSKAIGEPKQILNPFLFH